MPSKPKTSDEIFNTRLLSVIRYLFGTTVRNSTPPAVVPTVSSRLNISTTDMDNLWQLFYLWTDYYPKTTNALTYNVGIKNNKNDTRAAFEKLWSRIRTDLKQSALTIDDRAALFLPVRDAKPTQTQPKQTAPLLAFEPSVHCQHILRITNPDEPTKKSMPKGQQVFIERYEGEPNLPEHKIPFNKAEIVSTYRHQFIYEPAQVGKTAYYRPCYITRSGKKGITGKVLSGIIF
jgi:hypothetical protein